MKTSFKDIYLPVKNNLTGVVLNEEHKTNGELQKAIRITFAPEKPYGKRCISGIYFYNGRSLWLMYGKTIKEIKALINDINDFRNDPHSFFNL